MLCNTGNQRLQQHTAVKTPNGSSSFTEFLQSLALPMRSMESVCESEEPFKALLCRGTAHDIFIESKFVLEDNEPSGQARNMEDFLFEKGSELMRTNVYFQAMPGRSNASRDCLRRDKTVCPYKNVRFHYIDIRDTTKVLAHGHSSSETLCSSLSNRLDLLLRS